MLHKMLGWVGGMTTFLALAHMLDATQDAGLGSGDANVPCTCTHAHMLDIQFELSSSR